VCAQRAAPSLFDSNACYKVEQAGQQEANMQQQQLWFRMHRQISQLCWCEPPQGAQLRTAVPSSRRFTQCAGADAAALARTCAVALWRCEHCGRDAASSVSLLLQAGAAVDATCIAPEGSVHTALHVASMRNMPALRDCLQALLDGGADLFYKTARGLSALHYAAGGGNLEGCKMLYAASAGRTLGIEGWLCSAGVTPLMMACNNNEPAAVQLLCELGADVNCCNAQVSQRSVLLHWRQTHAKCSTC
jgi:Ankyrin repeats (3 copies)